MNNSYLLADPLKERKNIFSKNRKLKLNKLSGSISPKQQSSRDIYLEKDRGFPLTDINDLYILKQSPH